MIMRFPIPKIVWRTALILAVLAAACYVAICYGCTSPEQQRVQLPVLGGEVTVLNHNGFVAGYDEKVGEPRWVVWNLEANELDGPYDRKNFDFGSDPLLPPQKRVERSDYKGSGYSRGHMCPAADMKWSAESMRDCHYMTNMCPQNQTLNGKWWEHLEKACRRWAQKDHEGDVWIACGPLFDNCPPKFIGNGVKVRVPEGFYKVVVSLRPGHEKGIGFMYRNDNSRQTMEDAACTIDEVEKATGFIFFPKIPPALRQQCNLRAWK